jgi:hypothetical protein
MPGRRKGAGRAASQSPLPQDAALFVGERLLPLPNAMPAPSAALPEAAPQYEGHRDRLRGRFKHAGPEALAD